MKNVTSTEIKHVENSLEILNEVDIEINLDGILNKESKQEMPSDISCIF